MAHGHDISTVEDPGGVGLPSGLRPVLYALMVVGALVWGASFFVPDAGYDPWAGLLLAYFFFLMLGLGGVVFTTIQYAANARWSIVVRRIAEGMGAYIPISAAFFLIYVIFGYNNIQTFESGGIKVYDHIKKAWLTTPAVLFKGVLFYAVWIYMAHLIRKNSLDSDKTKDPAVFKKNQKLSIIFLIVFGYTFSLHCIDLLKALEPRWFSTIFGVYCFSGMFLSTMVVISFISMAMSKRRAVGDAIQPRHRYDLGTWIMAFSVFMVYIGFSQYMLIWYANIPEETFFLIIRSENGWEYLFVLLPLLKWLIPFAFLMPQGFRANRGIHIFVGCAILLGQFLDLYWIIAPAFSMELVLPGLAHIGAFLALLGVWGASVERVYRSHSVLPMGDPYLTMSVKGSYL